MACAVLPVVQACKVGMDMPAMTCGASHAAYLWHTKNQQQLVLLLPVLLLVCFFLSRALRAFMSA